MAVEVLDDLGAALAHCLTVMSNPITTSVTRVASATMSLQASRPRPSNSHTLPRPADTASTDFHTALSREDVKNSSIGNDSSVVMAKVPLHPALPTPTSLNDPNVTTRAVLTDRSGQKMPGNATTLPARVADAKEAAQGDRTPDEKVATTPDAMLPPPYAALSQMVPAQAPIQLLSTPKPMGLLAVVKASAQDAPASTGQAAMSALQTVPLQVEPTQTQPRASPALPQSINAHPGPGTSASISRDASVKTVSSGPGGVKLPSGRSGQGRVGTHPDAGARSSVSDQEGQQSDPATTPKLPPDALAPSAGSPFASITTSSSRLIASYSAAGNQRTDIVQQSIEMPAGSGDEATSGVSLSVTDSPVAPSAFTQPTATFLLPSAPGISGTTSPEAGGALSQDLAQQALRHPHDDASKHPSSTMTVVAAPGSEPVTTSTVADIATVDPAAPVAPLVILPVKLINSYMSNGSGHTATSQVAPAMISLATRTDGSNEITVSLNPRDLGQVEVHFVRGSDGTTSVRITASNPETLQELSQNVHHLHAALDAANIPLDGRSLSFSATPTAATGSAQHDLTGRGASSVHDGGTGGSGGQDPGQGRTWEQNRAVGSDGDHDTHSPPQPLTFRKSWQVSGLNITA